MCQKQKRLAVGRENLAKMYVIEIKRINSSLGGQDEKSAGGKNEGKFHDVVEKKWRRNVGFTVLHDVIEKIRVIAVSPGCR
jgi:hypothetical protein